MSASDILKRLFCLHKCASCRQILDQKSFDEGLCADCRLVYNMAKVETCPECLRPAVECTCQPKSLSAAGSLCLRKLFFYHSDKQTEVQNKLVYFLKHQPNKRVERFVAEELLSGLVGELEALGVENAADEAVLVNVPRGRRAVLEFGFDQSERICQALSRISNIPYATAIRRRYGGREQKRLTAVQRRRNMRSLMRANAKCVDLLKGRYVILFDDIVTTGASMAVCLPILRKMGVKGVICCTLATDVKKKRTR